VVIWYIFSLFGILQQEKSGNPGFVYKLANHSLHFEEGFYAKNMKATIQCA
jgi:hypothetical protein